MKKIFYIIICFLLILLPCIAPGQSGNITNFLPLQTGNLWVYHCSTSGLWCGGCSGKTKIMVISSNTINGKTYYHAQTTSVTISGSCTGCGTGILRTSFDNIRIDSISGNVLVYNSTSGCPYSPNEIMQDSLKARLRDSINMNCTPSNFMLSYVCTDTNSIILFGATRENRHYGYFGTEAAGGRNYVKGIGIDTVITYTLEGGGGSTCTRRMELLGCVINGVVYGDTSMLVGIETVSSEIPDNYSLSQNYPNPFNPNTVIKFSIPVSVGDAYMRPVQLKIYDILGKEVATLVNQQMQPGSYSVDWDGTNYPSGVYFYRLEAGDYTLTRKMILIK